MKKSQLFALSPTQIISTLGMGMFDGIHRGHQHVLAECDSLLTFHPHPRQLFHPVQQLKYLTPLEEKKQLFYHVIALKFNANLSQLLPIDYLNLIQSLLSPQKIIVGYDFKFGKNRTGNTDTLTKWGQTKNIDIEIKAPYLDNRIPIKSSTIRNDIISGNIKSANHLLGRPYCLIGNVVKGKQRGRQLGYPTANLIIPPDKLLPKNGVYFGTITLLNHSYRVALSIGTQTTFNNNKQVIEAHIINFSKNLYGQHLKIKIHQFIRNQNTFNSEQELQTQIKQDIKIINSL